MKINVKLENCYGINKLEKEFDFSNGKPFCIYASNGTMKTSFAKTFEDLSKNEESKDIIYPERKTIRHIKKSDDIDLSSNEIFVINSYKEDYKSDNVSKLLVNEELKKKYDNEYTDVQNKKTAFLNILKKISGLKTEDIENEICKVFHQGEINKFFESLNRVKNEVLNDEEPKYSAVKYSEIFNSNTNAIIKKTDFLGNIENYVNKYNELLEKSVFFEKGVFNHTQAFDIAEKLKKDGFFEAKHSVFLNGKDEKIETRDKLVEIINKEKDEILKDANLKEEFDKLDEILKKNIGIKKFREYIANNPQIVSELLNVESFKSKLWISYFKKNDKEFSQLLESYERGKNTIEKIKKEAQREKGDWDKVISEFNRKFFVPFELYVDNKIDVILNDQVPKIQFKFENIEIEEQKIKEILSQGEKRALYILNLLFEIENRKKDTNFCLFVIDDIADSFDYKNKYAIIEYLKEISENENFYLIILTHNFDFHRSVCSRLDMKRRNKINVLKLKDEIKLGEEFYQKSPLNDWRENLDNDEKLLASIPMVRNLFEYSGKDKLFKQMTSFLHIKDNTKTLTLDNLKNLFENIFESEVSDKITATNKNFYDLLIEKCDDIYENTNCELEHKIILSIAIRLKAEEFMILKINDHNFVTNIIKHQTFVLFKKYKELDTADEEKIKILEKVNLMTPENIHLNSFMYEPILDMGIEELISLYKAVSNLKN